jgi:hypothetical protein
MSTGTSKTALSAARVALLAGVSATALLYSVSGANAEHCLLNANIGTQTDVPGALACGPNATATGANSTAVGPSSFATGTSSSALGFDATATGNGSVAAGTQPGFNTGAFGTNSIGVGTDSKYPPAEPGALALEPLEAADGGANAAPKFWAT